MIYTSEGRLIELLNRGEENNPFVAWQNLGAGATLGGSGTIAGGEAANAVTGSTYDKWRPIVGTGARALSFDFGTARTIRFAAIVAHNVGSLGGQVAVERSSDNVNWTDAGCGAQSPADNSPAVFRMVTSGQSFRYWRFHFPVMPNPGLAVGVAFMGDDLIMPRRLYQGFAPVITPTEVQLQSNVSQGNELLGSSVVSQGSRLSATVSHIPAEFIRGADWLAFQRAFNSGQGFFFGWRPRKYPQDVHYCWRDGGVIRPENSGPRDLMSVAISARARNNG